MATLEVANTQLYTGVISIDGQQVKQVQQAFNTEGLREGALAEYLVDKELYYNNLKVCREQEDAFIQHMRDIEDKRLEVLRNGD